MRGIKYIILLITFFAIGLSCKKEPKNTPTEFDLNYSTTVFIPPAKVVLSNPTIAPKYIDFSSLDIPTESYSLFLNHGTTKNLIDNVKLKKFEISVADASKNLNFLKSIILLIKTKSLAETVIASKTKILDEQKSILLDVEDVNLKNYMISDTIQYILRAAFDLPSTEIQALKLNGTFFVNATLLKKQ